MYTQPALIHNTSTMTVASSFNVARCDFVQELFVRGSIDQY